MDEAQAIGRDNPGPAGYNEVNRDKVKKKAKVIKFDQCTTGRLDPIKRTE